MKLVRIRGPLSEVEALHRIVSDEIVDLAAEPLECEEILQDLPTPGSRRPLGMEPLVYFAIATGAHVAGHFTYDAIKLIAQKVRDKASKAELRAIVVEEQMPQSTRGDSKDNPFP